ncbi:MAG: Mini-ribonuclease 3 [Clostridiales Family XIII bacterium]|jgi:ribonuclease-3 family protein|nr:Mini-ribonuclease 3 [Clostridiales Family XIII bacterium]
MRDPMEMNTGVLAYIGDAVYELYVRKYVTDTGQIHANRLHTASVKFVKAEAQAMVCRTIASELPEEERALIARARNRRIGTGAKNAKPMDYKWATAFEALLGYYYLSGRTDEMEAIISEAIRLIASK